MEKKKSTTPKLRKGTTPSPSINPRMLRRKRRLLSVADYVKGILEGSRIVLGQAITIIESTRAEHQIVAQQIIESCLPYAGKSIRIGITGTPGVGKSTFIESFGTIITQQNRKLATLAIDPTSQVSKGSILGDKTRMASLSINPDAFIRPSPAGDSLGGVARKTRETIILCEAAGYDTILIETVGVGQSETAVHSMVDLFLLLLLPGAGDELQGIKRGIVEMADVAIVNKADGEREQLARQTKRAYRNALHLFPPKTSNWTPQVVRCSALEQQGIEEIWAIVAQYYQFTTDNDFFSNNRKAQAKYWLYETIQSGLQQQFFGKAHIKEQLEQIEKAVLEGKLSPFKGAEQLLKQKKE